MSGSSEPVEFPGEGRLLGLDFGTRRVGSAVSTPEQTIASPLENYTRQGYEQDARHFEKLVKDYDIKGLVVGLPVHMSGEEGGMAREARVFGLWVAEVTGLPVIFWDERYTSATAEEHLISAELSKKQRKRRLDKLSAQIMLQSFLEAEDRDRRPQQM